MSMSEPCTEDSTEVRERALGRERTVNKERAVYDDSTVL